MAYINKNNIEFRKSIYVGRCELGEKMKMRIDKLTLVSDMSSERENENFIKNIRKLKVDNNVFFTIHRIFTKKEHPYKNTIIIRKKNKNKNMLLRIDFSPYRKETGFIRLEFRPQHLNKRQLSELLIFLNQKTKTKFVQLLNLAWITQLDIALDLYHKKLKDYIWGLTNASSYRSFNKPHGLPGLRIGSNTSRLHFLCYEKIDIAGKTIKCINDHINIDIDNYDYFLRIEARIRPKKKFPKDKVNLSFLEELENMKNPFIGLKIYSLKLLSKLNEDEVNFQSSSLSILSSDSFLLKNKISRASRNNGRLIKKYETPLFDIDLIWEKWYKCYAILAEAIDDIN